LHLIEPFGFKLDDKSLKRAGMDYWEQVEWQCWPSWIEFERQLPETVHVWFIEHGGPLCYTEARYAIQDCLVFGRETAGLPKTLLEDNRQRWLHIPMFNPKSRSLNLANCAAIVLYEALRQQGFPAET